MYVHTPHKMYKFAPISVGSIVFRRTFALVCHSLQLYCCSNYTHVSSVLIVDFSRKIYSNKKKSRNEKRPFNNPTENTWQNKIMRMNTSRNVKWRITFTNTLTRCIPNTWNEKVLHNQRSAFPSSENAHFPACCSDHFVNSSDICPAVLVLIM